MQDQKPKSVNIGSYLLAKDNKTKYIKLEAAPNADADTKALVERIKAAIGGDILYVNLFDPEFRMKHNIPDFVKGRIQAPLSVTQASSSTDKDEVPF